jgi:hypothetical protein
MKAHVTYSGKWQWFQNVMRYLSWYGEPREGNGRQQVEDGQLSPKVSESNAKGEPIYSKRFLDSHL